MHRRGHVYLTTGSLVLIIFVSQRSEAQFSANFQTNILSGVGTNWFGNYYVGSNTFADVLLMHNSAVLGVSGGYLGYEVSASNNTALLTDPGTVWSCTAPLVVGNSGANNSLIISNNAQAQGGTFSYVGYHSSSSNNTVRITGSNSSWGASTNLYIGYDGSGNTFVIENGGGVRSYGLGYVSGSSGSRNSLVVSGTNSYWNSTGNLTVGGSLGASNSVVVSNGAQVVNGTYGYLGVFSDANSALITGTGSIWSIATDLRVGGFGRRNSLVISNGGVVVNANGYIGAYSAGSSNSVCVVGGAVWQNNWLRVGDQGSSNALVVAGGTVYATNLTIGFASAACNNLVELDSGSLNVTNGSGGGVLEVRHGGLVMNGGVLHADTLVITNPCAQLAHTGGSLIVSNVVLDPNLFRITSITRQSNDLLITWMMGPGATNALQVVTGGADGGYRTTGFTDLLVVTNNPGVGTVTNYLDLGAATNTPARYYRARFVP